MLLQARTHGSNEIEMGERTGLLQDKTKSSTGTLTLIALLFILTTAA